MYLSPDILLVALSFVVTTNADAIRVKVRVKAPQPDKVVVEKKQQQKEENKGFIYFIKQVFGVRV